MKYELTKHIDFLLKIALQRCGNTWEAQDLCQETFLSALKYLSSGKVIDNIRPWLVTVLNRKYYDALRQKYNKPAISYDLLPEIADDSESYENIIHNAEAEELRRQVAYLSGIYREVIIRYYLNGESVESISKSLNIPQGMVKSRLSNGRKQIKKGFEITESYAKESYEPITLDISNSGNKSIKGEPQSLVEGDLIAQNLLYLAYNEPVTVQELAKAIGIPMAYIEPIVKKLVDGELMRRVGNKVYTDFMISSVHDEEKYIPAQKEFIGRHFVYDGTVNQVCLKLPKPDRGLQKLYETTFDDCHTQTMFWKII